MSMHRRRERTHTVHGAATLGANYAILHLPGARRAMSQPGASEEEAMSRPIALLPLALAMSCAHAPAPGPAADVVELDARWAAAAAAGDGPGFRALVSADALFAGRSLLRGSEEVWGAWKAFFDEGGPRIRWAPVAGGAAGSGDLAWTTGRFRLERRDESGSSAASEGQYLTVWAREPGG